MLEVTEVSVRFGSVVALDGLTFAVPGGVVCGLVGPGGAGKTTTFNVISRMCEVTAGSVRLDGKELLRLAPHRVGEAGVARTFQNLALFHSLTVLDNIVVAHVQGRRNRLPTPWRAGPKPPDAHAKARAMGLLHRLGLSSLAHRPVSELPFGAARQVELARAMAAEPKLLLLDEPAKGLSQSEMEGLGDTIRRVHDQFSVTMLLIERDMRFVARVCDWLTVLQAGRRVAEGTPEQILNGQVSGLNGQLAGLNGQLAGLERPTRDR